MFKKSLVIIMSATMVFLLSGCTQASMRKEIKGLEEQVASLKSQNEKLQVEKDGLTVTEESVESSLSTVEGETVPSFKKIDGLIKFPNKMTVPNGTTDVNTSVVRVGSIFEFSPTSNWLIKQDGSTVEFNHPSKIWGKIQSVMVEEDYTDESFDMKGHVQQFFDGFPKTNISYQRIYLTESVVGMLGTAKIKVDDEDYVVTAGYMAPSEYGAIFLFAYKDDKSGVQKELIESLLTSGKYGEENLQVE